MTLRFSSVILRGVLLALGALAACSASGCKRQRSEPLQQRTSATIPCVIVTERQILVNVTNPRPVHTFSSAPEQLATSGVEAPYKQGFLILPLADELNRARAVDAAALGQDAIIVGAPSTPYAVLIEVLYTTGKAGFDKLHLMLPGDAGASRPSDSVNARYGRSLSPESGPSGREQSALGLRVWITAKGAYFKTSGGVVGADCVQGARGVTVPKVGKVHDFAGVTKCARHLKGTRKDVDVVLVADPFVDFATIIDTMDALSGPEHALFPEVHFGVPRKED